MTFRFPQYDLDPIQAGLNLYGDILDLSIQPNSSMNQTDYECVVQRLVRTEDEDRLEFVENYMVITSSGLINFYEDRFDYKSDPNKFLLSFPRSAIQKVMEQIDDSHLLTELNSEEHQQLLQNKFGLKLNHDFLNLFLHGDYELAVKDKDQFAYGVANMSEEMRVNNNMTVEWYHNLLFLLFDELPHQECQHRVTDETIKKLKSGDYNVMKAYLLERVPILSCYDEPFRLELINIFNEMLSNHQVSLGMNDSKIQDTSLPN